jgi:hypothetical protein
MSIGMSDELPPYLDTQQVVIDGEPYVRLRTVYALLDHTDEGLRFSRWRYRPTLREFLRGGQVFEEQMEMPSTVLRDRLGELPEGRGPREETG